MVVTTYKNSGAGPIFIVGMNGSGTTMLLDHLNHHSQLYGFKEESRILPYYLNKASKYGDLCEDQHFLALWEDMRQAFPFWKLNQKAPIPLPDNWQAMDRSPAAVFDAIMHYFASREGKPRWCEKTPMHVTHMLTLSEHFPSAKFIHVIRDGRECSASFHRRWQYHPQSTMYRWKQVVKEGRRQGALLDSNIYKEVMFEQLTTAPEPEMRSICEFLGVDFEAAVMQTSRSEHRMSGATSQVIVPNSGKYKTYFSKRELEALERIAGKVLASLGYPAALPDSDKDPARLKLWFWSIKNHFKQGLAVIHMKLRSKGRKPWRMVYYRFKSALQQKLTNKH